MLVCTAVCAILFQFNADDNHIIPIHYPTLTNLFVRTSPVSKVRVSRVSFGRPPYYRSIYRGRGFRRGLRLMLLPSLVQNRLTTISV